MTNLRYRLWHVMVLPRKCCVLCKLAVKIGLNIIFNPIFVIKFYDLIYEKIYSIIAFYRIVLYVSVCSVNSWR